MTFLEELTAHKGGLILLRSDLFWYGGRGWDGTRGRICLLMDSAAPPDAPAVAASAVRVGGVAVGALLLFDGAPHWVWVAADDLELL
jgi:hypothetical protein